MKVSRRVTALALIALLLVVGLELYLQSTSSTSSGTGPWGATTPYPLENDNTTGVTGQACVTSNATVYCIGGEDYFGNPSDEVYSATLYPSGLGAWTKDANDYPQGVTYQSCVEYSGDVYCVGGTYDTTADDVAFSYFAPLSPSGVGEWEPTTSYPVPVDTESCVASTGYIYCVGGEDETTGTNSSALPSDAVYYASLSPSGIGNWTATTSYPSGVYYPSCTTVGGYVYCVGDENGQAQPELATYYASLSSQGVGSWTSTTEYPIDATGQSCVVSLTDLYCIAGWTGGTAYTGAVYYAQVTPSGIGAWQAASSYPLGLLTSCVGSSGYVYCIGGTEGSAGPVENVYYGLLAASSTTNSTSSSTSA